MDHINIDMPDRASAESLAAAIANAGGMEHPERNGVMSVSAEVTDALCLRISESPGQWKGITGLGLKNQVLVSFPPPKPDIPALIKAWHADPTDATRSALAKELPKATDSNNYQSFIYEGTRYWATADGWGVVVR